MAERLVELVLDCCSVRKFGNVLELGCGVSSMAPVLLKHVSVDHWVANDIVPMGDTFGKIARKLPLKRHSFIEGDMEVVDLPAGQDLIVSNAAIQWVESLDTLLARLVRKLSPGGILAFSTFGPENLQEIREITGLSLDYLDCSQYASLLVSENVELLVAKDEPISVPFVSPVEVLRHLKKTGVNSLSRRAWTRRDLRSFTEKYESLFCVAEGVSLTYHPVYVIFRRLDTEGS